MTATDELRAARLVARNALERAGKLAFKPVSSAKWVDVRRTWTGKLHVCIEHDTIRGCTPQMMRWWFENLARLTTWNGQDFDGPEVSFYHLWHHGDHVAITPLGHDAPGFAEGKWTRVSEQFNDFHERISAASTTDRLDDQEFAFTVRELGLPVCKVIHRYSETPNSLQFYAETVVGSDVPVLGWLFNWLALPFIYTKTTAENWIRHNIEETGRSEDVLPPLYARHRDADA